MILPPPPIERHPIARAIFDALSNEMKLRSQRACEHWIAAERLVVTRVVNEHRALRGLPAVSSSEILKIERSAVGHVDYLWKYAYRAEELVVAGPLPDLEQK